MILDACVAVPLVINHQLTVAARRLAGSRRFVAPAHILVETANTLWKYAVLDGLDAADAVVAVDKIASLCDEIVPDRELLSSAIDLAIAHRHPVYDCLYLALALERREPVATADRRLAALAQKLSIEIELIEPAL
jgi:predicted nucleic acid-binding protein